MTIFEAMKSAIMLMIGTVLILFTLIVPCLLGGMLSEYIGYSPEWGFWSAFVVVAFLFGTALFYITGRYLS